MNIFILLIKNSVRNLIRNHRRTTLTLTAVLFSTVAMVLTTDYNKTNMEGLKDFHIKQKYGHIQIKKKGYYESEQLSFKYMLTPLEINKINDVLENENIKKNIKVSFSRINLSGLIINNEESTYVMGYAIEPGKEVIANSDLNDKISEGNFLKDDIKGQIVIGKGLAKLLKIKLNQSVYFYSTGAGGLPDIMELTVCGIIHTGIKAVDDVLIYVNKEDFKSVFVMENVHDKVIFLDKTENTNKILTELKKMLDPNIYEIFGWEELATEYKQIVGFINMGAIVGILITVIVLIFLSTNTLLMNVMERMNEFGTLRAIGRSRFEISTMIIIEGAIVAFIGSLIGVILGGFFDVIITSAKIHTPPPPGTTIEYTVKILFHFSTSVFLFFVQFFGTMLGTIYPILKINKIKIIDAIRYR